MAGFAHTPSSIGTFQTCPRQYEAKYITKTIKFVPNEASEYGDRLHEALELAIDDVAPLPSEFAHLEPLVAAARAMPGEKFVEQKLAIDCTGAPVEWGSKAGMARGIIDFAAVDGPVARVVDWKSGKPKSDDLQLIINAACIFAHHPEVNYITAAFAYTKTGTLTKFRHQRSDFPDMLAKINHLVQGIETVEASGNFRPTPSGLCKAWCGVMTCSFNGRRNQ